MNRIYSLRIEHTASPEEKKPDAPAALLAAAPGPGPAPELLQGKRIGLLACGAIEAALTSALNAAEAAFVTLDPRVLLPGNPELNRYDVLLVHTGVASTASPAGPESLWLQPENLRKNSRPLLLIGSQADIYRHLSIQSYVSDVLFAPFIPDELVFRIYRLTAASGAGAQPLAPKRKCVLVADDDPDITLFLKGLLRSFDVDIHFASDGRTALSAARQLLPDLLLMDVGMPFLSGIEVLRRLRADPGTQRLSTVLLTASSNLSHVRQSADLGVEDYILKPFSHRDLSRKLKALLNIEPKILPGKREFLKV